ncbi:hypothetical protein [uncultured Olegusella sp.]|uniref:hypothetical protein n=1 Tax=uncultured Olegusella sp. TaxID=1979846 RepID=UPI0026043891|nr:hypothetical protein [uncultured Olegusella sp.]
MTTHPNNPLQENLQEEQVEPKQIETKQDEAETRQDESMLVDQSIMPAVPAVIESISGTTSPDNSTAGNKAYLIAGIAVLLLFLLIGASFSGLGALFEAVGDELLSEGDPYMFSNNSFGGESLEDESSGLYSGQSLDDSFVEDLLRG